MKETVSIPKDQIENVKQVEFKKQLRLTGRYIPQKGHTIFEVNRLTNQVVKAEYEDVKEIDYLAAKKGLFRQITTKKVIVRDNCIYISALNIKNCFKKLGFVIKK